MNIQPRKSDHNTVFRLVGLTVYRQFYVKLCCICYSGFYSQSTDIQHRTYRQVAADSDGLTVGRAGDSARNQFRLFRLLRLIALESAILALTLAAVLTGAGFAAAAGVLGLGGLKFDEIERVGIVVGVGVILHYPGIGQKIFRKLIAGSCFNLIPVFEGFSVPVPVSYYHGQVGRVVHNGNEIVGRFIGRISGHISTGIIVTVEHDIPAHVGAVVRGGGAG